MFHNYYTPQAKSAVPGSFAMTSVSELDVLLSQVLVVAENKNEMKNISQLPLFIYPGDSEFISQEIFSFPKKQIKNTVFFRSKNVIIV